MPYPQFEGVLLDTHHYQMFSVAVRLSLVNYYSLFERSLLLGQPIQ